jgi:hypothetical protein
MKEAEACMDEAIATAATDQEAARAMARECLKDFFSSGHGTDKTRKKGKSG